MPSLGVVGYNMSESLKTDGSEGGCSKLSDPDGLSGQANTPPVNSEIKQKEVDNSCSKLSNPDGLSGHVNGLDDPSVDSEGIKQDEVESVCTKLSNRVLIADVSERLNKFMYDNKSKMDEEGRGCYQLSSHRSRSEESHILDAPLDDSDRIFSKWFSEISLKDRDELQENITMVDHETWVAGRSKFADKK